jgi:hypothetical protein
MATEGGKETLANGAAVAPEARALSIGAKGIATAADFSSMMSALMSDLIDGRVKPQVANAICNAGGKLLKMVELQQKYGAGETKRTDSMRLTG